MEGFGAEHGADTGGPGAKRPALPAWERRGPARLSATAPPHTRGAEHAERDVHGRGDEGAVSQRHAAEYRDNGSTANWQPPRAAPSSAGGPEGALRGKAGKGTRGTAAAERSGALPAGPALTLPVVPSPSTTSLSWRSGPSSSSESDMISTPPAGKEKRRRAAGRDGVQEQGGERRKRRAPRSLSRQRCRGRSRHLPSARLPSLWPARDETNERTEGRGRG